MSVNVVKKSGVREPFDIEKIHRIVLWSTNGLSNVSVSDIEMNAKLNVVDGITTDDIHGVLIASASNLISIECPDYQYVAGRLLNYQLRKKVWGGKNPPKLVDLIKENIERGFYTKLLLESYSEYEINKLDEHIDHDRDLTYTYCSVKQLSDKYLIKNQSTGDIFETPQFRYMVAAMTIFRSYEGAKRIRYVKRAYDYFSRFKINLATPQLSGLGTNNNSYASCGLFEMLDTSDSINAVMNGISRATAAAYGIGVNFGRMRAIKSPVKGGVLLHPGVVPFLKIAEANTKAWQKNGVRGGSATVTFPIWHYEIRDIVQLKNAMTGISSNRVFNLDYLVGISRIFYERFLKNEDITLFSPSDVPGLYDSFGTDTFDELYLKYEKSDVRKETVNARELFQLIIKERQESGRIYILNVDNVNKYGVWNDTVYMSNLCVEIAQAIQPIQFINDPESEIGVCVLSAINWLEISSDEEMERVCDVVVRMLDEIIDIQDYFDKAAENFCTNKRSLGIGVTNLAAFLARHKIRYTDEEAVELVDEWMERQQYYLLKASTNLAREKGPCNKFLSSKYSNGFLPIDKNIKTTVKRTPSMDWEGLRKEIKESGLRHTTLTCQMPCESSSASQNVTNGVEPVRNLLSFKSSKKSSIPFIVPNVKTYGKYYQLAFDMPDNIGYFNVCAAIQKWMDMSMSTNQYTNPQNYEGGKVSHSKLLKELIYFYQVGGKSLYYLNTDDQNVQFEKDGDCAGGACTL